MRRNTKNELFSLHKMSLGYWGCSLQVCAAALEILVIKGIPSKHYEKLSINNQEAARHKHHPHAFPEEQLF